jgi:SAM-dependent methyltransferase
MAERTGNWRKAATNPGWAFLAQELALLGDVAGKRACVLGSGDNLSAFALAGLGADVTSVDISEKQLDVARVRADSLGLKVRFLRADVTDLSDLQEFEFDIVHTGRHVAVWVTDLRTYYQEAVRILKPGGLFLVTEYHPVRRIFEDDPHSLKVASSYLDRGPFYREAADGLFDRSPGPHPCYESHWTIADLYHAIVDPGCELIEFDELGDDPEGWEVPPLAGLPQLVLLAARKLPANARRPTSR